MNSDGVARGALVPVAIGARGSSGGADSSSWNCGTSFYAAPEMRLGSAHCDNKVDVWSLGVILLELFLPFRTKMERADVLEGMCFRHDPIPESVSSMYLEQVSGIGRRLSS